METRRLRRIKPQPAPVRRLRWLPQRRAPGQPQSEQEEISALLVVLRRDAVCRLPLLNRKAVWPIVLLIVLLGVIAGWRMGAPWTPVAITVGCTAISLRLLLSRLVVSQRQIWAVRQLTGVEDLRAIPPLAAALGWAEPDLRTAASAALTRLLPHLQTADAALLDTAARAALHKQLATSRLPHSEPLALAILKGIEQAGDRRDLRRVVAIAGRQVRTASEQRLQRAAQACLLGIKRRSEQEPQPVDAMATRTIQKS